MRRSLAALAAAALLLSSVGSATGAGPDPSASSAPIGEPTPSVDPPPTADPSPAAIPDPGSETDPATAATTRPSHFGEPATAPIVETTGPSRKDPATTRAARAATDPTDRWIVVLKPGSNVDAAIERQGKRIGFVTDRTYRNSLRGYSATLDRAQVTALSHDASVAMIVADEKIQAESQALPTGITRIGANRSTAAKIDGVDVRVDADVAIVDTGIAKVADLNVAGGYNCSTSNRAAWRDVYGHGTHVAGTVGAIDNGIGVVGVAPGVRLWAVKILDDTGDGLLSWYVCGLDWIAAQHDPVDPTRPRFEAVNMSVAKRGSDDRHCGAWNKDILHAAICRLVASGVTVVAAAGNDSSSAAARVPAAYNEVITVSALADTDGKPGAIGGHRCFSWGTYDNDDSFADFSNRGSDVDLIAPGKCIWSTIPGGYAYSSGTSMAAPHVTGAVALLKASRPALTPVEVREALIYLGTYNWKTWTDPDGHPDKLLDVSRIGPRGDFSVAAGPDVTIGEAGGSARFPITITRTATSFERIRLAVGDLPAGATASLDATSLYGFAGVASTLTVTFSTGTPAGSYPVSVTADEHGNTHTAIATVVVEVDVPTAQPPATAALARAQLGTTSLATRTSWPAATDPTTGIAGYELESSVDGGAWVATTATSATVRSTLGSQSIGHAYRYRVRAQDTVGNWSAWANGPSVTGVLVQDRSSAVSYSGTWTKASYTYASGGSTTWAVSKGARARTTFSGRGIALVAPTSSTRGSAAIYIDGVYRTTISFRSAANHGRVVLYSTSFATLATHTIELRLSGNGRVDLDTFVILR
ncbi:MAG TPA: S8 family serine peptidase [Candidatus Limnocylindrales bacterium]|nr:S8 family serine peptidase [Candidatus Limnocylindrales bacterium]